MDGVVVKKNRFNNVLSQLSCELEEFSQKDESASFKQIKILTGKFLQLLSSSDVNRCELLQKQNNIQVLFQIFKTFCTKDQQITLNILETISKVCTAANRISSLVEVGILSVLFDCLTKMAANVSILQNDTLSVNTLALCHVLIAKVAPKEKKFATISRLSGALESTVVILKLFNSDKIVLASIQVLKLNATSSVNCALMIKVGIVTLLQKIITTCGQRKVQILKASLDLLSAVFKLEKGVKKAVNVGMIIQLLNVYKTWHKWDLKNSHVSVRKSILNAIKACVMFSFGSKIFLRDEGFRTIYFLAMEHIDKPEVDALIKASIIILRKCSTQKIPLRTEWCPYSFPLPKASLLVNQTSSTSTSGQCSPTHSVIKDGFKEEKNIQLHDVSMKVSQLKISLDQYADFMPELNVNEECDLHSNEASVQDHSDEELKHGKSSHSFRHISSFLVDPAPDVFSDLPPFQPEFLFEKKPFLLRYKIFEDFQRILFPDTVLTRTVFDLDELIHGMQPSCRHKVAQTKKVRTASMKTEKLLSSHLKPPLKKYSSVRDLAAAIQVEILKKDPLTFESRFESGNLRKAIQVRSYEYDLILNADINTSSHHQWFYFQVGNMESRVPYRFNIINCEKASSQFNNGMQPLLYSMKELQRGGCQRWIRTGNNTCYYKNYFVKDSPSKKHYYTATFTIAFPHAKDTCYLAYHYPYTYSLLINHLYLTESSLSPSIFYSKQVLCSTLAGNEVLLITITSKEISKVEKIYVFLTARVHPGETNSSWMMKGIVDFLTSNNEEACLLRSAVVFKIIPMLNPDGVINGCHRCSLSGQDLNRKWKQPDADLHPTIFHTKSLLKYLVSIGKKPEVFVDFHGHSRKKNIFMYGCREFNESLSESLTSLPLERNRSNSFDDIELLPKILNQETPYFCISQCNFSIEKCKESTARVVSYREFGIRKSYTMESTYCGMDQGILKGFHIGTDGLEDMGRSFCSALLKLPVFSGVK